MQRMPKKLNSWSPEVVDVLERLRLNCNILSEHHRRRFFYYKGYSKYFDIPVLILSVLGSSLAVGTQRYLEQSVISALSCVIGVIITIITSIKLYLSIDTMVQLEIRMSKAFYSLSIEIFHILSLPEAYRSEDGINYLQKCFSTYQKLMENSDLLVKQFKNDHLTTRPLSDIEVDISSLGSSDNSQRSIESPKREDIPSIRVISV